MENPIKTLLVSSEVAPFSKTGGLADVSGSLPGALKNLGCDIRVTTPLYKMVRESGYTAEKILKGFKVKVGKGFKRGDVSESVLNGQVKTYLIEKDQYYNRKDLYGTSRGDYSDNAARFIFFSLMVFELCKAIGFKPDVIHCNDWQSGLIPAYLRTVYRNDPFFKHTAVLFTIHNLAYQGNFPEEELTLTGLPPETFTPEGIEFWGKVSFLKAGIVYSEVINTVSQAYSREIQTTEYGCGMEGILAYRKDDLFGIINGVDYEIWSPEKDTFIAANYSKDNLSGKIKCKADLISQFGLPESLNNRPLLGMISRLADQKGFDLLAKIMGDLMNLDVGFILLGTGEQKYHKLFSDIAKKYPRKAGIRLSYNNALAHKIEAGCDMFLMPSRYEPCGLNQIYSLKYGTIPVVRATGGLDDTIEDYTLSSEVGNGFKFTDYSPHEFLDKIKEALEVYENKDAWLKLVRKVMSLDFSWENSARQYIDLYQRAMGKPR
ncbi:MAG: glycogen synthase GlgA [Deltaproteobacteria bacterium]|nr:glycogen synthase GlgA [Deltaproteobacteria bacterium]